MGQDIDIYVNSSAGKLDPEYIRSKYTNRQLQLAVEKKDGGSGERIAGDPAVISDCFAQHVAFYKQDYFFGLYGPLKDQELTSDIRPALSGRMVMVCYNRKGEQELAQHHLAVGPGQIERAIGHPGVEGVILATIAAERNPCS